MKKTIVAAYLALLTCSCDSHKDSLDALVHSSAALGYQCAKMGIKTNEMHQFVADYLRH